MIYWFSYKSLSNTVSDWSSKTTWGGCIVNGYTANFLTDYKMQLVVWNKMCGILIKTVGFFLICLPWPVVSLISIWLQVQWSHLNMQPFIQHQFQLWFSGKNFSWHLKQKSDGADTSNILSNLRQHECILFTKEKITTFNLVSWLVGDSHQDFKFFCFHCSGRVSEEIIRLK